MSSRVLVVVPAFNEQDALPGVLDDLALHCAAADVLVVDDGSADATTAVARARGVRVLELPFNVGVGGALRAGLLLAQREGYDVAVQCDADGQHRADAVGALVGALESTDADIVIGARFAGVGDYTPSLARRTTMRMLAVVMSALFGTRLTDVTSGMRAFSTRAITLLGTQMPTEYLGDTIEALAVARMNGMRVVQVAVEMRERQGGTVSHRPVRAALYLGRACLMLALSLMRIGGRRWRVR